MELNGLVAKETSGRRVVRPSGHDISAGDVAKYCPMLADRLANESSLGIPAIVAKVKELLTPGG